jgi:hypothetical protein
MVADINAQKEFDWGRRHAVPPIEDFLLPLKNVKRLRRVGIQGIGQGEKIRSHRKF